MKFDHRLAIRRVRRVGAGLWTRRNVAVARCNEDVAVAVNDWRGSRLPDPGARLIRTSDGDILLGRPHGGDRDRRFRDANKPAFPVVVVTLGAKGGIHDPFMRTRPGRRV